MTTIRRWMVQLGVWLIRRGGGRRSEVALIDDALFQDAKVLVAAQQHRWPDRDGEAKRAQVYWQLINAHPTASKRLIAMAIEEAVCLDC